MNRILCAFALTLVISAPAMAGGIGYNWIEGGYSRLNVDLGNQGSFNEDGWHFGGSVSLTDELYMVGRYESWDLEGISLDIGRIGLGIRGVVNRQTDWFSDLSYIHTDAGSPVNDSNNGAMGRVGIRTRNADLVEFGAFGGYAIEGPEGDGFVLGGNALIHATEAIGVNLQIESYEFDVNIFSASLRATF